LVSKAHMRGTTPLIGRRTFSLACLTFLLAGATPGVRPVPLQERPAAGARGDTSPAPSVLSAAMPETKQVIGTFQKNQTITSALVSQGLPQPLVFELVQTTRPVYNLGKVKAGERYWLTTTPEGEFVDFRYIVDDEHYLTVWWQAGHFVPELKPFRFETRVESVTGVIEDSLFSTVLEKGEQERLAEELAGLFQWDIDFNTDIQKGDSFRLLVEKRYLNGTFAGYSRTPILGADLVAQKKLLSGVRFLDEKGAPAYFTPDGKSLKKSFLKSPLNFVRISSRFTRSRFHPILKIFRPHLGVDYAAPYGTPVRAVGAGMVTFAGWSGEGGRAVRLRHDGGYQTIYMHLQDVRVRAGSRVSQGDLIGHVGSSGLATGPHLDFRVQHNGEFVNPAKVIVPPAPPVPQSSMSRFVAARESVRQQLDRIVF
jgi:murein DD-endopeptidase MepM/ murein hydrolase activator NlpD